MGVIAGFIPGDVSAICGQEFNMVQAAYLFLGRQGGDAS